MIEPSYNDIQAKDIPVVDIDGGIVKIISGEYNESLALGNLILMYCILTSTWIKMLKLRYQLKKTGMHLFTFMMVK